MGKMEENGGNAGKRGNGGYSTRDVGCGGLWRDAVEENETKLGEKWEKSGTRYPFTTVPFSPFFRRLKTFPTVPFGKISSPHSPTEKWDFLTLTDTHRYGPVRMRVRPRRRPFPRMHVCPFPPSSYCVPKQCPRL